MTTFNVDTKVVTVTSNGVGWYTLWTYPIADFPISTVLQVSFRVNGQLQDFTYDGNVELDGEQIFENVGGTISFPTMAASFNSYGRMSNNGQLHDYAFTYGWTSNGTNIIFRVEGCRDGIGQVDADCIWLGHFETLVDR